MRIRRYLSSVAVLWILFLDVPRANSQATCDPQRQLELYLKSKHQTATDVLAFDHQTQVWAAFRWDGQKLSYIEAPAFERAFTNKPRLYVEREEQPLVVVINTNPLIFSSVFTGATEAPIEDLANLQRLTGLLGGFLSTTVGGLRQPGEFPPPPPPPADLLFAEAMAIDLEEIQNPEATIDAVLQNAGEEILRALRASTTRIQEALSGLQEPRSNLEAQLQRLNEANAEIKSYLQLIESRSNTGIEPRQFDDLKGAQARIDATFARIDNGRTVLRSVAPICEKSLSALRDAARLFRAPLPEKLPEKRAAVDQFLSALENIELDPNCSVDSPIGRIKDRLLELHADGAGPPADRGASPAQDRALRPLVEGLNAYLTLASRRADALKTTDELMTKRGDGAKVAGAVEATIRRREENLLPGNPCSLISGVIEVHRPGAGETDLRWSQVRSENFKIAVDSPYKEGITLNHPAEVTAGYELQRAGRWDFDVDVATVYTEIANPEFSAVDPDGDGKLVIDQTGEKGRAGDLAMFVSFQRRSARRSQFTFGPQLGVGFDTDFPALFGGFAVGISRYAKLGFGWTWQRIDELRGHINDPVSSKDDIKTRDAFDNNYYISLSITLDELPFFQAPED